MQQFTLKIEERDKMGRQNARRLRRAGKIPACVYAKGESRPISVSAVDFRDLNREVAGGAALIELTNDDGDKALTLIQEVQRNAITDGIEHIDFQEVARGESFVTHVPIHLVGEDDAPGVKLEGGMIDHKAHDVEIRCRPSKLPDQIEVDVSGLSVGEAVHISDLTVIEGVEYLGDEAQVIVSCQPPTVAPEPSETSPEEEVAPDEVPASKVKGDEEQDEETESGEKE